MFSTKAEYRKAWATSYVADPRVPLNVDIELASTCNARCGFCLYGDSDWARSMVADDVDGQSKKRFMPAEMAYRIIDEAHALGVPALKFNFRGESTLHPKFSDVVEYAYRKETERHDMMVPAFHDLLVNTNANCPDYALRGLMFASKVMVSLDSMVEATYKKIRVGLSLEKAQSRITDLYTRSHRDLWVRRVVCRENQHEDFIGAVKARWPHVNVSEHYAFDRNKTKDEAVHDDEVGNWERTYCGYPSQRLIVTASGAILSCCLHWSDEYVLGRFPEVSLAQAWGGEKRAQLAAQLRSGNLEKAPEVCRSCKSFMAYKRPERDFVQDREATRR